MTVLPDEIGGDDANGLLRAGTENAQSHSVGTMLTSNHSITSRSITIPRKNILRVGLVIFSIVTGLLITEVVLRILDRPNYPLSGWNGFADPAEKNQMGFRGQPIEYANEDFVIVLLGDSALEAAACRYEWMPERRLQFHLNSTGRRVRVFSIGTRGYGQDQQLLALREYLKNYRADLVVLWFALTNDIWNNIFPTHFPVNGAPKPTFWLEGGQLRGPSEGMGQPISEAPRLKLELLWRRLFHWTRDREWERRYPPAYPPMTEVSETPKDDWQQRWESNTRSMRDENLDNEKSHFAIFLTPRSERMQYGLDLTRKLLREIERLTQSHGGQFITFSNPVPAEEMSVFEGVHVLRGKYYRTSMAQYYDNLDYLNSGFTSHLIPITVEQWKVSPENTHLNEQATDQVMKDLAMQIKAFIP